MAGLAPPHAVSRRRQLVGVGLILLALTGCSGSRTPPSAEARSRCERQLADRPWPWLRPWQLRQCLAGMDAQLSHERQQQRLEQLDRRRRLAAALRHCQQQRPLIVATLEELRRAEQELAERRQASPPALAPPPPPLDEAVLTRYTREDAELDRQRHQEALAAWRDQRDERRRWIRRQQDAETEAQQRLDRAVQRLRALQPDLLRQGIETDPAVERRVLACDPSTQVGVRAPAAGSRHAP